MKVHNKTCYFSENVEDGEGRECVWEKGAWFVKETLGSDVPEKCVKRVSYYQWIPYILLLQVSISKFIDKFSIQAFYHHQDYSTQSYLCIGNVILSPQNFLD